MNPDILLPLVDITTSVVESFKPLYATNSNFVYLRKLQKEKYVVCFNHFQNLFYEGKVLFIYSLKPRIRLIYCKSIKCNFSICDL